MTEFVEGGGEQQVVGTPRAWHKRRLSKFAALLPALFTVAAFAAFVVAVLPDTDFPMWVAQALAGTSAALALGMLIVEFGPRRKLLSSLVQELDEKTAALEEKRVALGKQQLELEIRTGDLEATTTELIASQQLYASAARRMEDLFQGIPIACFSYSKEGRVYEWNAAAEELFCLRAYEVVDQPFEDILVPQDYLEDLRLFLASPFDGLTAEPILWSRIGADGKERWIRSKTLPVKGPTGEIVGAICSNVDFSERKAYEAQIRENMDRINEYSIELEAQKEELQKANARLEQLATRDGLTNLVNHRTFQERFEHNLTEARVYGFPVSLVLLDVDHFKKYNDTYGHTEGDEVLRGVASVLSEYEAEPNTAARYGGEEFVLVLPKMESEQAGTVAEEIRAKLEALEPTGRKVTASFGVTTFHGDTRGPTELIAQADKALYKSKADGRNRVTLASTLWADEEKTEAA